MIVRLVVLSVVAAAMAPAAAAPAPGTPSSEKQATCLKGYSPLREDAEKKGKMIKAASDRHAPPGEACKLVADYAAAEVKMIEYAEVNAAACGVPPQTVEQLRNAHRTTESLEKKICALAEQASMRGRDGRGINELLSPATAPPEVPVISDFGDPAYGRIRRGF